MRNKAFFLLLALLLVKCSGTEINNPMITKSVNGETVLLAKSNDFLVVLDGNPTTGYNWKAAPFDTTAISQIGKYEYKSSSDLIGAPGKFTFRFKALKTGKSLLKFYYLRDWEKGIAPIDSFKVNISIK